MQKKQLVQRLSHANSVFFECDIQQKLSKHILKSNLMAHNAKRLT